MTVEYIGLHTSTVWKYLANLKNYMISKLHHDTSVPLVNED